jgi:hypothetical protein
MAAKKNILSVKELTSGYEHFINNKEVNENGKNLFNKTLKKAVKKKTKPRASK